MNFTLSELLGVISSFLGVMAMIIVLTKMKGTDTIRISLILLLLITTLMVSLGVLHYSGKIKMFPNLIRIDSPIHYLLGPAYYFYTLSSINMNFNFRYFHSLNLVPFLINIVLFMPLYLASVEYKLDYYNDFVTQGSLIMQRQYLYKTISACIYLIAQIFLFYKYLTKDGRKHNVSLVSWISIYIGLQFICFSSTLFDNLTGLQLFADPYKFAINMVSFMLLSIVIAMFFFPRLLYGNVFIDKSNRDKYSNSKLSEIDKGKLLTAWQNYMGESRRPYLNPKLSINEAANYLNTNHRILSQVINEKTDMNFNDYVNSLRITEAKQLLKREDYRHLTIDAIAQKSGFNSKSPFYSAFKKHTGKTPKEYVKLYQEV